MVMDERPQNRIEIDADTFSRYGFRSAWLGGKYQVVPDPRLTRFTGELRDAIVLGICEFLMGCQLYRLSAKGIHNIDFPPEFDSGGFVSVEIDPTAGRVVVRSIITIQNEVRFTLASD